MIDKVKIGEIVAEVLGDGALFLVDVKVSRDNRIEVFIDGDEGVKIQDCIDLSRKVESQLDREEEDFELSVLSWGLGEPLKLKRQYVKNIGKKVELVLLSGEVIEGVLKEVGEMNLSVEVTKGKGKKMTVETFVAEQVNLKTIKVII
ncbi:MAG: ribosome assembly cofactor RimP [Bacteroidales bacterium]|jgi:ribosome maturation factor RimP|nr:ribosome assembly cofactor RimP [Bacteroidales bacterium]